MKSNLHNALMSPQTGEIWVANAADPQKTDEYQACKQPYTKLVLSEWLKRFDDSSPPPAVDSTASSPHKTVIPERLKGKVEAGEQRRIVPDADDEMNELLALYRRPAEAFEWTMKLRLKTHNYAVYDVKYPSPIKTDYPENNVVRGEYFRAWGDRKRPAVIVLHILEGKFTVARLVCHTLASAGIDGLLIKLPYYGPRRPPNMKNVKLDPDMLKQLVVQGVTDCRRGADILADLDTTTPGHIGICGVSLGGFVAALTAGVDGGFPRASFILAGGDLKQVLDNIGSRKKKYREEIEKFGRTPEELRKFLKPIDPLTFSKRLINTDVLMLNAQEDEIVPADCADKLAEAAMVNEIIWYPGSHTGLLKYAIDALFRVRSHFEPMAWDKH
jgi:dienelactone hydrolase